MCNLDKNSRIEGFIVIKDFNNITPKIHETAFVAPNSTVIGDVVWEKIQLSGTMQF